MVPLKPPTNRRQNMRNWRATQFAAFRTAKSSAHCCGRQSLWWPAKSNVVLAGWSQPVESSAKLNHPILFQIEYGAHGRPVRTYSETRVLIDFRDRIRGSDWPARTRGDCARGRGRGGGRQVAEWPHAICDSGFGHVAG